jgi:hypothetical protein
MMTTIACPIPARAQQTYRCCCVLRIPGDQQGSPCNYRTSGPDDPFCPACTTRHATQYDVISGRLLVETRLRSR